MRLLNKLGLSIGPLLWIVFISFQACQIQAQGIPPVAHFVYGIWDTKPLPSHYEKTLSSWKEQGWEAKLWNREKIEKLLDKPQYAQYKNTYNKLSRNIQKADLIRYLIVYDEGGFYFDLDCPPASKSLLQEMSAKLDNSRDIFFVETITSDSYQKQTANQPIRRGIPEANIRIANFAFGCHKNSHSLKKILDLSTARCGQNPTISCDYDIIYTTGPDCVTEVINQESGNVNVVYNTNDYMTHQGLNTWHNKNDHPK